MQITLPDHPKILSKAAAAGFATVEEYVRSLVEADAGSLETNGHLSSDDWQQRFNDLLASVEPGNPNFDDSRDSIYPVR